MYILTDLSRKEWSILKLNMLKKLSAIVLATGMILSALTPVLAAGETRAGVDSSVESKEPPEPVTVSMTKVSANPGYTDGNPSYVLDGAEYTIYTDSACTKSTGKKIVIKNGKGSVSGLPHNIYWVKETKKGSGFGMDTTVHKVDLRTATSGSFTSTEPPMLDPISTLIRKEGDFKPNASLGQTLAGAEFEVKFYAIAPNATVDPATQNKTPKWTWKFRTDSNGVCMFHEDYKVSGPDLPLSPNGAYSLPYGVVTIKETLAPNGFAINDQVFVANIRWDTASGNMLYQAPTIPETSIKIKIRKSEVDADTDDTANIVIPNVEFKHTFPNGNTEIVKTDSDGILFLNGLTVGEHTLEEVKVPDGIALDTRKIKFTVNANGTITGLSGPNTITDDTGASTEKIPWDIDSNEGLVQAFLFSGNMVSNGVVCEFIIGNRPAPFDLNIHKVNDKNASLEGAEFTLYEDDQCTQEVTKAVTDASGNLKMQDLVVGKTYFLKETKAPAGYKVPINNDGSEIIWKIKVISHPTKGEFTFYVNDKAYTSDSGQFHISGTPADRDVNMELINTVSGKLPKTGSNAMIIVIITGAILMIGAVIVSRFHKKK